MELVRQKNVSTYIVFPIIDKNGNPITGATGLDSEYSYWDDGTIPTTFADLTTEAIEVATTSGKYYLQLLHQDNCI